MHRLQRSPPVSLQSSPLSGRCCTALPVELSGVCCCACARASSGLGRQVPRLVLQQELEQKLALALPARPAQPAGCPQKAPDLQLGQKPGLPLLARPAQPAGYPHEAPALELGQKTGLPLFACPAQPAGCPQEAPALELGQKPGLPLLARPAQPAGCPQEAPDLVLLSALPQARGHQAQPEQAHLPGFQLAALLSQQPAHAGSHLLSIAMRSSPV